MKTKMSVEWRTGRPLRNGEYVVVFEHGCVSQIPFTTEYGWNTTGADNCKYAFPDSDIAAWTEPFGNCVIEILRHRDIIKGKEGEYGARIQCN